MRKSRSKQGPEYAAGYYSGLTLFPCTSLPNQSKRPDPWYFGFRPFFWAFEEKRASQSLLMSLSPGHPYHSMAQNQGFQVLTKVVKGILIGS